MIWERFHYVCRRCHETIESGQTIEECITNIGEESSTDLYGKPYKSGSITNQLLKQMIGIPDQSSAINVIDLYGKLDFSVQLNEPMQFKRVMIYLFFVTSIFTVVVGTYQLFVFPTFLATFDTFETSMPAQLIFLQDYWLYFVYIIFFLLLTGLVIGFGLRQLFKYKISTTNSFIFKYLTFRDIRKSYINILEAIYYPVSDYTSQTGVQRSLITDHLRNIESSGMDIRREIQDIIKRESMVLTQLCERQMQTISTVVAIIVITAIFFFLVGAYSPIFVLGETI